MLDGEGQPVAVALQPAFDLEVAFYDGREGVSLDSSPFGPGLLLSGGWVAALLNFV